MVFQLPVLSQFLIIAINPMTPLAYHPEAPSLFVGSKAAELLLQLARPSPPWL